MRQAWISLLLLALEWPAIAADKILFTEDFSHGLAPGWQNVAFFKKPTDYQARQEGTNFYLLGVADKGCSALSVKLNLAPPTQLKLRWRWRIDSVVTNGSERELAKFDHAARIFVAFDTFIGPPRTLNYLWANAEPAGVILPHPKTSRAQLLIVESGNEKSGQWLTEERDVTADWKKVFPDLPMPKVVGLGVMTDGDSLGQKVTGAYANLELIGE